MNTAESSIGPRAQAQSWSLIAPSHSGWLVLLFVAGLLARSLYVAALPAVLNDEGAEYARLAENLAAGLGYVGLYGGPQLVHAPLYPLAVASILGFYANTLGAARALSTMAAALLVPAMMVLACQLAGRRAAIIAGLATIALPALAALAGLAIPESLFLLLLAGGLNLTVFAMRNPNPLVGLAMGCVWGLAYLARPTAAIYFALSLPALAFVAHHLGHRARSIGREILLACLGFGLFAAPYVLYSSQISGRFSIENKSIVSGEVAANVYHGLPYLEAAYGIDEQLQLVGPEMDHTAFIKTHSSPSAYEYATYIVAFGPNGLRWYWRMLTQAIPLPFLVLAAAGLVIGLLDHRQRPFTLYLLALILLALILQLGLPVYISRYLTPLYPFILLWGAVGAGQLAKNLHELWQRVPGKTSRASLPIAVVTLAAVLLVLFLGSDLGPNEQFEDGLLARQQAGQWLLAHGGKGARIMDVCTVLPYYAGGELSPLPFAPAELAQRFITQQAPDYVVLPDVGGQSRPYLAAWLSGGIPDPQARLIYEQFGPGEAHIQIYRWLGAEPLSGG